MPAPDRDGVVAIACAGTSDLPVAEEAALTAGFLGNEVRRFFDVGVAGIHRLLDVADELRAAWAVVVAGMEARSPPWWGLISAPVIAVPTSVGYGAASFGGVTALLAMLNSCASGVSRRQHRQRLRCRLPGKRHQSLEFPTGINLRRFPPSAGASRVAPS